MIIRNEEISVTRINLKGRNLSERKEGYAGWQLQEESREALLP